MAGDQLSARDLVIGDGPGRLDIPGPIGRVAVAVSWEVFFPDRVREGVEAGGRLVLNPTNGSSFTGTIVQSQQVASSRLRAIESGRWVLQVAPTGFSAVRRRPRARARAHQRERDSASSSARCACAKGSRSTPAVGNAPALGLAVACLAVARWWNRRLRRAG